MTPEDIKLLDRTIEMLDRNCRQVAETVDKELKTEEPDMYVVSREEVITQRCRESLAALRDLRAHISRLQEHRAG